ncbi:MAG: hypothetical protein JKY13_02570, partial [Gammaproteobacteria bacterium]|nr:hypothetical protein [Gammaproteobacteria bacterium]
MEKTRAQLKAQFVEGRVPTEEDFQHFADSTLNSQDDGIKNPVELSEPLRIIAQGDALENPQQNLLDFHQANAANYSWRINQRPLVPGSSPAEYADGFNICSDEHSKLFIDRESGDVGINTVEPQAKLHIHNDNADYALMINDGLLAVKQDGNVGIGTENPQNKLDIKGNMAIGRTYSGVGGSQQAAPENGLIVEGKVGIATTDPKSHLAVAGGVAIGSQYASQQTANNNELLVEGKVGIGNIAPQYELDVNGTINTDVLLSDSAQVSQGLVVGENYVDEGVAAPVNSMIVQGKVGIATATPTVELEVNGTVKATIIVAEQVNVANNVILPKKLAIAATAKNALDVGAGVAIGSHYAGIEDAPEDGLIVEGYVGIGTDSPTEALDINGSLKLQGDIAIDEFSADSSLSANSNKIVPTQKALKRYIDNEADKKAALAGNIAQSFSAS